MKKYLLLGFFISVVISAETMDYKKIYKEASPGVVLLFGYEGQAGSTGTGSIISEDGTIVTNAHVVIDSATNKPYKNLSVFLKPKKVTGKNKNDLQYSYSANVLKYDEKLDVAVVKINNLKGKKLTTVTLSDSTDVSIGEPTVTIGHPESGSRWSLTTGAISGRIEDFTGVTNKNVFQMETAANSGNSGGPLLDYRGYMIGMTSSIARESQNGLAIVGVNFAIDSNTIINWLDENGVYLAVAGSDGNEFIRNKKEKSKEQVSNNIKNVNSENNKTKNLLDLVDDEQTVVKKEKQNSKVDAIAKKEENKGSSINVKKVAKKEVKKKEKFTFRIQSKRKYKKRSKKPVFKKKQKAGKIFSEKEIHLGFKSLDKRSKKAHKKLNKKLGSWENEEVPGF